MQKNNLKLLAAFVVTTVLGAALHFVYQWFPNVFTALFSPVNESIWEHLKILFWPYLTAALLLTKNGKRGARAPWLLSLLIICSLMLMVSYIYYIGMKKTAEAFGPVLYVILMALGFILPSVLCRAAVIRRRNIIALAVAIYGVAIVLFTFIPPELAIFTDLSASDTQTELYSIYNSAAIKVFSEKKGGCLKMPNAF